MKDITEIKRKIKKGITNKHMGRASFTVRLICV